MATKYKKLPELKKICKTLRWNLTARKLTTREKSTFGWMGLGGQNMYTIKYGKKIIFDSTSLQETSMFITDSPEYDKIQQ